MTVDRKEGPAGTTTLKQLESDRRKIDIKVNSGRIRTLEGKILRGTARPDQIFEWYLVQDPFVEQPALKVLNGDISSVLNFPIEMTQKSYAYGKAADILLAACGVEPETMDDFKQKLLTEQPIDFYRNLFLAAELMWESSGNLRLAEPLLQQMGINTIFNNDPVFNNTRGRQELLGQTSHVIFDAIGNSILQNDQIKDPETLMIGLDAHWKLLADLMQGREGDEVSIQKILKKKLLQSMISDLRTVFLTDRSPLKNKDVPKSLLKGKLMEYVWLLDSHVFLAAEEDFITMVFPTNYYVDMPHLGHPVLKRGADIQIRNIDRSIDYYVQLKSSHAQSGRPYHPAITVVCEDNFQDINPGRLFKKLEAYQKFVDSDFSTEDGNAARKYILPSVAETLNLRETNKHIVAELAKIHGIPRNEQLSEFTYRRFMDFVSPRRRTLK